MEYLYIDTGALIALSDEKQNRMHSWFRVCRLTVSKCFCD